MYCALCRKKIGPVRRLFDQQYCSANHRRKHRVNSARALREADDYHFDYFHEEPWMVASSPGQKTSKRIGPTESALLAFMAVGFLLLAVVGVPGGGGGAAISVGGGPAPTTQSKGVGDLFRGLLPKAGGVTLKDDFRAGLSDWAGAAASASDWSIQTGFVRPGRLRLWQKSMDLSDYYLEFQAQIERKSVGWAFRAKDSENYYAAKISITQPGPLPRADLIRYIVTGGHTVERTELPLPLSIRNDTLYRVRMKVVGDRFHTVVNDQTVDSWSDHRYPKGGVGFFADKGEVASIRWVRLSDHEGGFLDRILSPAFVLGPLGH